jgi:hypothetical protein
VAIVLAREGCGSVAAAGCIRNTNGLFRAWPAPEPTPVQSTSMNDQDPRALL